MRDVQRELRRGFTVGAAPERTETREYFDTFDWRLFRGGLSLSRVDDRLNLTDISTGEQAAQAAWRRKSPPRFARDLPSDDLRRFVSPLTDPRALLPVARVRVKARALTLRRAGADTVGVIRLERATVTHAGKTRRLTALLADVNVDDARGEIGGALSRAGFGPSQRSWFETLMREAGCHPADYVTRPNLPIGDETSARVAFATILMHLHDVMRRNEPGMRDDIDPEFLHDYRVALRRTRAALGELRGILPAEVEVEFRERLRALAPLTGRVRDLDVHLARHAEYLERLPESLRPGLEPVFADMRTTRRRALDELRVMLASRDYIALMRDWKRAIRELARGERVGIDAEAPAIELGRHAIRKRYDRLSEIASAPEALDPAALHRARLDAKKLRYVIEFLQDGLGRKAAAALARIESAQDALGEYNDLGVQMRFCRKTLDALADGAGAVQCAAALGGMIALLAARRRKVRRRCERRLRALRDPLPAGLA